METYSVSERLPECGVPIIAHAINGTHYRAVFDGVDFAPMLASGKVLEPFISGAVLSWSPIKEINCKAQEYNEIIQREAALRELERKIAYDAARECIEIDGVEFDLPPEDGGSAWYDITQHDEYVADRVSYLEQIGRLIRLDGEPNIVRVVDMEEEE